MGTNFWVMILQIVVFLPFIVFLIYLTLRFGGNKLQGMQNGRYIKVHERTALTKENSLLVVQLGKKGYVLSSSNGKVEIIKDIEEEELKVIISQKALPQYTDLRNLTKKLGLRRKGSL